MRFLKLLPLSARYMLLSALGFSLMAACVKLASQMSIPLMEIVAARALISLVLSYADVRRRGVSPFGHKKGLLVARAVAGTAALMCLYYAVTQMPLADATVLQYLQPMFTALIAWAFLKERIHASTMACIVFCFIGMLMIARPEFMFGAYQSPYPAWAIAAALAGSFGAAVAYVLVRKLNETEDTSVIILYFPLFALPSSLILLGDAFVWPSFNAAMVLLAVGICTQIGQIGLTKAMQTETAGKAMAFSYVQVIFAAILGWVFFSEVPGLWTYLGAGLIILGALINLYVRGKS